MASYLEFARVRYQGRLTQECFMAGVPDWIQYADDNVLFPSGDLTAANGSKCIKFSSYQHFSDALHSFWNQYGQAQDRPGLRVIVMPYTPVADAHRLHEAVLHPELLPVSFAEAFLDPVFGDDGEAQNQGGAEEDEEDGPELIIWEERAAVVTLPGLHVDINFIVANYGLLWAKAEWYCVSAFTTDAVEDLLERLSHSVTSICPNLLKHYLLFWKKTFFRLDGSSYFLCISIVQTHMMLYVQSSLKCTTKYIRIVCTVITISKTMPNWILQTRCNDSMMLLWMWVWISITLISPLMKRGSS